MQLERRALYTLLRMSWLNDSSLNIAEWQKIDYRTISNESLFKSLEKFDISLHEDYFVLLAKQYDNPEDLAECITEEELEVEKQDEIYLIIFELWRRMIPEKMSLSIFCDELDHQINLYDQGDHKDYQTLQNLISNLESILDENIDQGEEPTEIFQMLLQYCANDIESFLYDFISEQLELNNFNYASELTEEFYNFVKEKTWFDFLRAQISYEYDQKESLAIISKIIKNYRKVNVDLLMEILAFLSQNGSYSYFHNAAEKVLSKIYSEDDFQEYIAICADFYNYMEMNEKEATLLEILKQRKRSNFPDEFDSTKDHDAKIILNLF